MSEEDPESETRTMEGEQIIRDALMQVWFTLEGNEIEHFTGTNIPIPRKGESVRLSNIEVPSTEETGDTSDENSSSENQPVDDDDPPLETQTSEGKEYLVGDVSYNYYKAMLEDDSRIDAPVIAVGVEITETDGGESQ